MLNKPYALHPGYIRSIKDNQWHYIKADKLAILYGVQHSKCITWDDEKPSTYTGRKKENYIHLFPKDDGNYLKFNS